MHRTSVSSLTQPVLIRRPSTNYKDALKYGFYEQQSARDWYREVTADVGMHAKLVHWWIRVATLLIAPIAPHFSEHVWSTVLQEPQSVHHARWPAVAHPVDRSLIEAGQYMRGTIKMMRDAELSLLKKMNKGKQGQASYDPKRPRAVRIYVASSYPAWQDQCVEAVKEAYAPEAGKVDDVKIRELLTKRGLIKDKRAMPFVQMIKVRKLCCSVNIGLTACCRNGSRRSARKQRSSGRCCSPRSRCCRRSCPTSKGR